MESTVDKKVVERGREVSLPGSYGELQKRLKNFIRDKVAADGPVIISDMSEPSVGASSGTLLFTAQYEDKKDEVKQRLVLRTEPSDGLFPDYDLQQQYDVQSALVDSCIPIPKMMWGDFNGEYMGSPSYVMTCASGRATEGWWYQGGPLAEANNENRREMIRNIMELMSEIHALDYSSLNLPLSLSNKGSGENHIEREVNYWYRFVEFGRPDLIEDYQSIRNWLVDKAPQNQAPVLLHGDIQGGNFLWEGVSISCLLDWEHARIGVRETDIAWYHITDQLCSELLCGGVKNLPTLKEKTDWYEQVSGVTLENMNYHLARCMYQLSCCCAAMSRGTEDAMNKRNSLLMEWVKEKFDGIMKGQGCPLLP